MASSTMKSLLHPIAHHRDRKSGEHPHAHSGPLHDRSDSAMDRPREEEKRTLAEWEERKQALSPDEIDKDPEKKIVGHSSKVLREEDFELIKTLGTGAPRPIGLQGTGAADADSGQVLLRASGWCA